MHRSARFTAPMFRPLNVLGVAAAIGLAGWAPASHAQAGKHGAYAGTAKITYSEGAPPNHVLYRGEVRITIPLTSATMGELDDVDKPSATARITHIETSQRDTAPDSGGKINTVTCKLAAPVEVPLMTQGALNLTPRKKAYWMYFALIATKPVKLDCVHSRSGAHKRDHLVGMAMGTHEVGIVETALPYADPARLAAKHFMVPGPGMKSKDAKVEQEWDLQLRR